MKKDTLTLKIEELLWYFDYFGLEELSTSDAQKRVDELEQVIRGCNERENNLYTEPIADSIYDHLYSILKKVRPESDVFSEVWSKDDEDEASGNEAYTELLDKNPMFSIETAKSWSCSELNGYIASLPDEGTSYFASYKINGHGIRVVYKDGFLVSATSRGRSSAGRDLTQKMKWLLGDYNENLSGYGLVELRGELALKLDKLEDVRSLYNENIKSAFSAVSSLIRPSSTEDEVKMLDFLCYGFICDGFDFVTREEEFQEIDRCGYLTPEFTLVESATKSEVLSLMKDIIQCFEDNYDDFGYFCDGVVFEVNDRSLFRTMGIEGNHTCGNIALKVGIWEQCVYTGVVNKIIWTRGKVKLSPVAIVSDNPDDAIVNENGTIENIASIGVLTSQGNRVKRVPLYEPKNILILDAYEGNILSFRYGGEAGVVPCFPDGRLLKEDATKAVLEDDDFIDW